MSFSLEISILRSYLIIIIMGSVILDCISTEAINYNKSNDFGIDFLSTYSYLNKNETLEIQANCSKQLQILENALTRRDLRALKFPDAWAKLPAGIMYGRTMDMGNFDECLSINTNFEESNQIEGKYCLINLELSPKQQQRIISNSIQKIHLDLGICVPMACSAFEVQLLLNKYIDQKLIPSFYNGSVILTEDKCTTKDTGPLQVLDWIAIGVLIILGTLLILSTSYEYIVRKQEKSLNPLLSAFSVRKNMCQLMHLTPISETPKHIIPALNGIRCLSIIWIIFLHTYMMLILSPNINNADQISWQQTPFYMIWKNGNYAVDSFFFLSGLLLVSVAFREMEKNSGKLNIPLMYLHRFIRLSPVLYLAVLIFMTLFRFSGNGPIWNSFISSYQLCEDTWWATLLYVQNYAATGRMCLGHSWYLAVDTQLYVISPLALILIWRWRKWGLAVLLFIGLLLIVCLFSIIIVDDLIIFDVKSMPGSDTAEMRKTYLPTHTRASPWIIGIIFGYFLHVKKGRRIIISKILVLSGWLLTVALFLIVIFALYPKTQSNTEMITPLEGAFYLSLSHIAWPLGLCWLVFACVNGYAGPINDVLSWYIWQPLSKLSYCMYIWHLLIVTINAGQIKTNSHFSNYDAFLRFWSDFGITLIVSTIMYLTIEAPMLGIEKFLLSKRVKKSMVENRPATTISQQNLCD